jgi:hypothetical protein
VRKFFGIATICCCFCAVFTHAQSQKSVISPSDKWEIFGGYTFQRNYGMLNGFGYTTKNNDVFAPVNANGGQAAVSYFPQRSFGVTYQMTFTETGSRAVSDNYSAGTQNIETQSYLIGPVYRYSIKNGNFSLFAHMLFGATHNILKASSTYWEFCPNEPTCTTNGFSMVSGGGLNYRITPRVTFRPVQLEYWNDAIPVKGLVTWVSEGPDKYSIDGLRYTTGVTINF